MVNRAEHLDKAWKTGRMVTLYVKGHLERQVFWEIPKSKLVI